MKTTKLQKAIDYLVNTHHAEYCTYYGEPGYQDPEKGAYRVLFQKRENSQFYCRFAVYADFEGAK